MAEGLKSALKEILAREVVEEETRGEVTAWLPHNGEKQFINNREKLPHNGEKAEREIMATLEFSLKMHQRSKKYGKANTVHYDFKPQTRSDIQSESELIFGPETLTKFGLDPAAEIEIFGSDSVAEIEPLDLQLTPTSGSLNLTRIASQWENLPDYDDFEIPTDPKTMIYNLGRNMIINVLYMVALLANRMMAA